MILGEIRSDTFTGGGGGNVLGCLVSIGDRVILWSGGPSLSWCKAPAQLTPLFITAAAFVL